MAFDLSGGEEPPRLYREALGGLLEVFNKRDAREVISYIHS